jgi:DNA-binding transcriptional ArsR family regulator
MAETLILDYPQVKIGLSRIKALAHPLRLQIISFIDKNGETNVNKIYRSLKLEQSITSQHLKILRAADVVETRREGKKIFYSLNYGNIRHLMDIAVKFQSKK